MEPFSSVETDEAKWAPEKAGYDKDMWFHEQIDDGFVLAFKRDPDSKNEYSGQSKYQSYRVVESIAFGTALMLDNLLQSTEFDEKIYHESLVHPAMLFHGCPEQVMVLGGGEGATLREVLLHKSVKKATMVDIDEDVVKAIAKFAPNFPNGAYEDPRTTLIFDDAYKVIESTEDGSLDVLICDLNDPLEDGPCFQVCCDLVL
jgi:spermidine synthase